MKNKLAVTLTATGLAFYGVIGFVMSIGYTAMNPIFFYSIMAAIFLSPIAIFWSVCLLAKEMTIGKTLRSVALCLLTGIISIALLILWLFFGEHIGIIGTIFYVFVFCMILAVIAASAVYALSFLILAVVKKLRA